MHCGNMDKNKCFIFGNRFSQSVILGRSTKLKFRYLPMDSITVDAYWLIVNWSLFMRPPFKCSFLRVVAESFDQAVDYDCMFIRHI